LLSVIHGALRASAPMIFEEFMALLLKAESIKGLISIKEAIDAVESGFRDQARHP
jgi:hypothetical protein